jgi:hypothetical protein
MDLSVISKDPPIFLSVALAALATLVGIAGIIIGRRNSSSTRREIQAILSTPAILEVISKSPHAEKSILEIIEKINSRRDDDSSLSSDIIKRVVADITWDVSGVIGVAVTIALLIMMVSRQSDAIPPQLLAGWTTILGFYFGKAVSNPGGQAGGAAPQPAAGAMGPSHKSRGSPPE